MKNNLSLIKDDIKTCDLNPGDVILIDDDDSFLDFGIVLEYNKENDTVICFDCYHKDSKTFNIGEYKKVKYIDIENIFNCKEFHNSIERED